MQQLPEDTFDENNNKRQVYKIQYTINLLPRLAEHVSEPDAKGKRERVNQDICIMGLCVNFGGLEVFDTSTRNAIEELITFKWTQFG